MMRSRLSTGRGRVILAWLALFVAIALPTALAAASPLLEWRQPVYILAGFAGIAALALLLVQPLLIGGDLPGLSVQGARRIHRLVGIGLVIAVVVHVAGLWITSPPDVIDALLFASPTPFSAWGVVAMWAIFAAALLAAFRRKLRLRLRAWRIGHVGLALVVVIGSIVHSVQIDGTMETVSKAALCALVAIATAKTVIELWRKTTHRA
jgi:predicted ferric reductase